MGSGLLTILAIGRSDWSQVVLLVILVLLWVLRRKKEPAEEPRERRTPRPRQPQEDEPEEPSPGAGLPAPPPPPPRQRQRGRPAAAGRAPGRPPMEGSVAGKTPQLGDAPKKGTGALSPLSDYAATRAAQTTPRRRRRGPRPRGPRLRAPRSPGGACCSRPATLRGATGSARLSRGPSFSAPRAFASAGSRPGLDGEQIPARRVESPHAS